jgi:O-succinylbenzoate synthase
MSLPTPEDLLADSRVVQFPLVARFRGLTVRETMLIRGPRGWGEFAAFGEYDDTESAPWLACAIEQAWGPDPTAPLVRDVVRLNATLPAVTPDRVAEILDRFPDARTVKVKVAEPGHTLSDDVARVTAARAYVGDEGRIRIDANGGWNVDEAEHAIRALEQFDLEYVEQPCASVEELAEIRRRVHDMGILIAADESVRKATDPIAVARAGAADILVIKVAPLGGVQRSLDIIAEAGLPVVISSALESPVGLAAGLDLARRVPQLPFDCGLDTGNLFSGEGEPVSDERESWWRDRAVRCLAVLASR